MMQKLEFKHIAPYLPHNLKCKYPHGDKEGLVRNVFNLSLDSDDIKIGINFMDDEHIWMFKPLLRPMSDLFKNIVHNEEEINVGKEILNDANKILVGGESYTKEYFQKLSFHYWEYWQISRLFEFHFDVFGLMEKGLAEPIEIEL